MSEKRAAKDKPTPRSFQLPAVEEGDEDAVRRVSFGASSRVSIDAGETYTTDDPALAARLAAEPLLQEVTK